MQVPLTLADTVHDLAARERACCSFLEITVTLSDTQIDVDIVSPDPDGQAIVEALAGRL